MGRWRSLSIELCEQRCAPHSAFAAVNVASIDGTRRTLEDFTRSKAAGFNEPYNSTLKDDGEAPSRHRLLSGHP
jgi:hypothetical protein